jgi:two-component system NarL family sensor kinase
VIEHGSWQGESTLKHFVSGETIPVSVNSFLVTHPVTGAPLVLATVQRDLRERKRAEEQLRERADEVEQLAAARRFLLVEVLRAEERLRRQLGDALHDQVLQELLAARQDLAEAGHDGDAVGRARAAVDAASRQLREVVHDLHPAVSWTRDLEARLGTILQQGAQRGGFEWRLDFGAADTGDADEVVLAVVRELTQNVVKHAEASLVSVAVREEAGNISLDVSDDGRGMPPERPGEALREGHIGLASTRERVDALGGSFEIESSPGAGTRLRVVVPRAGLAELPRDRDVE